MSALGDLAAKRHPSVRQAARWLDMAERAPDRPAAGVAWLFQDVATKLLEAVHQDDPELTRAVVLLTQAKDAAVRAKIAEG